MDAFLEGKFHDLLSLPQSHNFENAKTILSVQDSYSAEVNIATWGLNCAFASNLFQHYMESNFAYLVLKINTQRNSEEPLVDSATENENHLLSPAGHEINTHFAIFHMLYSKFDQSTLKKWRKIDFLENCYNYFSSICN